MIQHRSHRKTPGCPKGKPPRGKDAVLRFVPGRRENISATVAKALSCLYYFVSHVPRLRVHGFFADGCIVLYTKERDKT